MKRIVSLLFLLYSALSYGQTAVFSSTINTTNEDMHVMPLYDDENPMRAQEEVLAQKYADDFTKLTLLRAIGIENYKTEISDAFKYSISGAYNSYNILAPMRADSKLKSFIIKISANETIRNLLADFSIDVVCDLCKFYPKDFKREAKKQIQEAKEIVESLPSLHIVIRNHTLYVNGERDYEYYNGLRGFLIRRIYEDDIPLQYISDYIDRLSARVDATDVSSNKDYLGMVTINDELDYCISATGNFFYFKKNNLRIVPSFMKSYYAQRDTQTSVECFTDNNSHYYKIRELHLQYDTYSDKWKTKSYRFIVIDSEGNQFYQE